MDLFYPKIGPIPEMAFKCNKCSPRVNSINPQSSTYRSPCQASKEGKTQIQNMFSIHHRNSHCTAHQRLPRSHTHQFLHQSLLFSDLTWPLSSCIFFFFPFLKPHMTLQFCVFFFLIQRWFRLSLLYQSFLFDILQDQENPGWDSFVKFIHSTSSLCPQMLESTRGCQ